MQTPWLREQKSMHFLLKVQPVKYWQITDDLFDRVHLSFTGIIHLILWDCIIAHRIQHDRQDKFNKHLSLNKKNLMHYHQWLLCRSVTLFPAIALSMGVWHSSTWAQGAPGRNFCSGTVSQFCDLCLPEQFQAASCPYVRFLTVSFPRFVCGQWRKST